MELPGCSHCWAINQNMNYPTAPAPSHGKKKTASSARVNRAFHLLVFPWSCVFKFEPVQEPEPASVYCRENLGFHPILKTDWQIQTDLIQCQELLAACLCCHPKKKKEEEAAMIEGRSRNGNVSAGAKDRSWISPWSENSQREESEQA